MRTGRKRPGKRAFLVLTAVALACLLLAGLLFAILRGKAGSLPDQTVAEAWRSGERAYVQLSCFLSDTANVNENTVRGIRADIEQGLTDASVTAEKAGAALYFDAFSAQTFVTAKTEKGSSEATAYFTGGDFFRFHAPRMVSGWYYTGDDLMDDGAIISRALAWKLYGGYDLTDREMEVNGYPCVILGVFDDAEDEKDSVPMLFLPYSLLYKMKSEDIPVTCYEAVLPQVVSNFGEGILEKSLASVNKNDYELTTNTGRFDFLTCLMALPRFFERSSKLTHVYYPTWENRARKQETVCLLLTAGIVALLVFPALYLLGAVVWLYANKKRLFEAAKEKIVRRFRKRSE